MTRYFINLWYIVVLVTVFLFLGLVGRGDIVRETLTGAIEKSKGGTHDGATVGKDNRPMVM